MVTHYVDDFEGKRNPDGDPVRPASVEATPVENDVTADNQVPQAKVVSAPDKATPKTSTTATTKG